MFLQVSVHSGMACVACMTGGIHGGGHAWRGHVWQGGVHSRGACVAGGGVHGRYYKIRSMSGQYASYWNAFLFTNII